MFHGRNLTRRHLVDDLQHEVWPLTFGAGAVCLLGIIGNLFVVYIHCFRYKRCNFRCFVLGLCVVDLIACMSLVPLEIYGQMNYYSFKSVFVCKGKTFLSVFTSIAFVYILLMIAMDRFRKVINPHGWQLSQKHVKIGYIGVIALGIIQASPSAIVWGVNKGYVLYKGHTIRVLRCGKDESYKDTLWSKIYMICLIPNYIVMGAMVIMYIVVFRRLSEVTDRMANAKDGSSNPRLSSKDDMRTVESEKCLSEIDKTGSSNKTNKTKIIKQQSSDERKSRSTFYDEKEEKVTSTSQAINSKIATLKRITFLTFAFTTTFIITAITYMIMSFRVAEITDMAANINLTEEVCYMLGIRIYFINYIMHPVLYGFLDPNFRRAVRNLQGDRNSYMV